MIHYLKALDKDFRFTVPGYDEVNIKNIARVLDDAGKVLIDLENLKNLRKGKCEDLFFYTRYLSLFRPLVSEDVEEELMFLTTYMLGHNNINMTYIMVLLGNRLGKYRVAYFNKPNTNVIYNVMEVEEMVFNGEIVLLDSEFDKMDEEYGCLPVLSMLEDYDVDTNVWLKNIRFGTVIREMLTDKDIICAQEEFRQKIGASLTSLHSHINHKVHLYRGRYEYYLDLEEQLTKDSDFILGGTKVRKLGK